jgi:hypothetical protein
MGGGFAIVRAAARVRAPSMATYDLDRTTLAFFHERLSRLTAASPRQWGAMDVARMLRHLTFSFEMSLGEQVVPDKTIPVVRELIFLLFFRWFTTWPAPEGPFDQERAAMVDRMWRFVDALEREPDKAAINPGLGAIPLAKWSRVHGVHLDHHLRQFGV